MKQIIIFLLFTCLTSGLINAQVYFSFSEKIINADFSVFQPIARRGFSEMNEGIFQVRPGIKIIKNRWSFTSHYSFFLANDQNKIKNKAAELRGQGFSIGSQYHLTGWGSFKVFPSLEVGVRKYYLDYSATITTTNPSTFRPTKEKITLFSFNGLGFYGDIGIGLEKIYPLKNRAFGIGFEAGYRLDYGTWELSDPIPINNANASHNGTFLNIHLLFALQKNKHSVKRKR